MPKVVIQRVHCLWTKQSRGGDGARTRNAVPLAVLLPGIDCDSGFALHTAVFSEETNFKQADVVRAADDFAGLGLRDLLLRRDGAVVHVQFVRDSYNAARPSSYPHHDVFGLRMNDWLRIVYNGRYVDHCSGVWWYEQSAYSVGFFSGCSADVFVATEPVSSFFEMAKLR